MKAQINPEIFQEFPLESNWDVIVIGGGPNGLIAAAYLARAGLKVAVVESRYEIGGGLVTEEVLFPGYYSNAHVVYHMMVDYMPAIKDFNLDRHALVWIKPNLQTAMVFGDGSSLLLTRMIEDTKDSISKFSYKDAMSFGKVIRTWRKMVEQILAPATYIPTMAPVDLVVAMQRTAIGRELLEINEKSPLDIINGLFTDDRVKALMLYASCMWGLDPRETGVGLFVPLLLDRGMNKCYCYGGSHKFAGALAREIVGAGGTIIDAARVTKILIENGHAAGVEIAEGRTLRSKVVMSTLDPQTTFLDLVGEQNLPKILTDSVKRWKYDKWSYYTLHVASEEAPRYKCDDPWASESFMTIFGFNSSADILSHWDNVISGKIDINNFGGHSTCESLLDPNLVHSPYKGYVSFFQMHAPYMIAGSWDDLGKNLEEAVLSRWEQTAPNFQRKKVLATSHETPVGIATRFPNMRKGGIKHGDYTPIQLGSFRPNQDCSSTKTPIEGLYVCGVSTYPGGLVLGGPGYLGANKVAEDLGVKKWWKPTPEMQKYIKTYLE